jgi:hypothetical protein
MAAMAVMAALIRGTTPRETTTREVVLAMTRTRAHTMIMGITAAIPTLLRAAMVTMAGPMAAGIRRQRM